MEDRALTRIEEGAMTLDAVISQVSLIQSIMKQVMVEEEHYGIIPGTKKPSLYKPGAEKLCLTFRLEPDYEVMNQIRERDFISYTIKCILFPMKVAGLGSCNSRETKYRYRSENTGRPVPKEYWKDRDSSILGGPQYTIRKKEKQWFIFEQVDNDNPWDLDNTLLKMACKRALVAATLNATAASDIFTQDLEDLKGKSEDIIEGEVVEEDEKASQEPQSTPQSTQSGNKIHCPKYKKEILKAACNTCTEKTDCESWSTLKKEKAPDEPPVKEEAEDPIKKFKGLKPRAFKILLNKQMEEIPKMSQEHQDAIKAEWEKHFSGQPFPLVLASDKAPEDKTSEIPIMLNCPRTYEEVPAKDNEGRVDSGWCENECNPEWKGSCVAYDKYQENIGQ